MSRLVHAAVLLLVVSLTLSVPAYSDDQGGNPVKLYGGVSRIQTACEAAGITLSSASLPAQVDSVHMGSQAMYAGVARNDKVLSAEIKGTQLNLEIERDGKRYVARIDTRPLRIERPITDPLQMPQQAVIQAPQFALRLRRDTSRVLADYDLELILDRSMSMRKPDCPGGLSRWDWCSQQATDVAAALSEFPQAHLTITSFATHYDVYEHARAQNIIGILQNTQLEFGTRLAEPLSDRLDSYMQSKRTKPLLIAVITDGVPFPFEERQLVKDVLIQATQQMSNSKQVTVVFLQIGDQDFQGKRYLHDLEFNLMSEGARYPIVLTKPFDEVKMEGLGEALGNAIKQNSSTAAFPAYTSSGPQTELAKSNL